MPCGGCYINYSQKHKDNALEQLLQSGSGTVNYDKILK